jgi:hypothetical protein
VTYGHPRAPTHLCAGWISLGVIGDREARGNDEALRAPHSATAVGGIGDFRATNDVANSPPVGSGGNSGFKCTHAAGLIDSGRVHEHPTNGTIYPVNEGGA